MMAGWLCSTKQLGTCPVFFTVFLVRKSGVKVFWMQAQPVYFSLARTPLMVAAFHLLLPVTVKIPRRVSSLAMARLPSSPLVAAEETGAAYGELAVDELFSEAPSHIL